MKLTKFYMEDGYIFADEEYKDGDNTIFHKKAIKIPLIEFSNNYQINVNKEFIHDLIDKLNNSL